MVLLSRWDGKRSGVYPVCSDGAEHQHPTASDVTIPDQLLLRRALWLTSLDLWSASGPTIRLRQPVAEAHPPLSPAEVLRLLTEKRIDPKLYAKYRRTEHWVYLCSRARAQWSTVLDQDLNELECICGCGREAEQWHHTNEGYQHLFDEFPIRDLRPMAARCHKKLHAGRKR